MVNAGWNRLSLRAVTPQTGSVRIRERVCISGDALGPLLRLLRASGRANEWMVLSTCGRTEVYAVTGEATSSTLDEVVAGSLSSIRKTGMSWWRWPLNASGIDAARHLLRVAGGIESIVLGDVQLLGQLRTAYASARAEHTTGPLLNRLCQAALNAGKRARTETAIAKGTASMASAAVELATIESSGVSGKRILIVGGGRMGQAIATALAGQRCEEVTVATRAPHAFAAGSCMPYARAVPADTISALLPQSDVIFMVSGTATQKITFDALTRAMASRATRPMLVLDLEMPQAVDPAVAHVSGVRLVTLDMLERVVEATAHCRGGAIKEVERIVEQTLDRMLAWSPRPPRSVGGRTLDVAWSRAERAMESWASGALAR